MVEIVLEVMQNSADITRLYKATEDQVTEVPTMSPIYYQYRPRRYQCGNNYLSSGLAQ